MSEKLGEQQYVTMSDSDKVKRNLEPLVGRSNTIGSSLLHCDELEAAPRS